MKLSRSGRARAGALSFVAHSTAVAVSLVVFTMPARGAPFTAGSIVAYRVGNSSTAPSSSANAVVLDEYLPNGTLLQSIAMPTTSGTSPLTNPLTASNTGSEGLLNRSVDGTCLTVPGYAAVVGYANVATATVTGSGNNTSSNLRAVAFVSAGGAVDTTTTLGPTAFAGNNFRGAATDGCTHVWTTGNGTAKTNYGVWYAAKGASNATQLYNVNSQGIAIANTSSVPTGQLFVAFAGGGTLSAVGTGLPTSGTQTITALSNIADYNYRGVAFLTLLGSSTSPDTLYLINNNYNANYGSLDKYSYSGGTWNFAGRLLFSSLPTTQTMQGLTAVNLGDGNVALYFTNGKAGIIYQAIDDSGPTGTGPTTFTTLVSAPPALASGAVYFGLAPSPVTALPIAAPGAPTNATESSVTASSFTASWTAPAGGIEVDTYVVEVSTTSTFATIAQTLLVPATATSVNVTGVSTTSPVYYRVRALNGYGASTDLVSGVDVVQTITFGTAPSIVIGSSGTVSATATSGLPVVFASQTPSICTVSGSTVTGVAAGTCTITADQAGNAEYAAAAEVSQSFGVGADSQTITFATQPVVVAGGAGLSVGVSGTISATDSAGLPLTFSSSTPTTCTVNGSTITGVAAGTCTIVASQAGNASYAAAQASVNVAVGQGSQTISFGAAPSVIVNGTGALSAQASSGLAVIFTSATPAICTVSGSVVTGVSAGTCTVNANQPGNANYLAAPQASENLSVGPGNQTIAYTSLPNVVVGSTDNLNATASSGLAVSFATNTPGVCSVSGNTVTGLATGTCTIAADQGGNSNYVAATETDLSFNVNAPLSSFLPGSLVISTIANVNNGGTDLDTAAPIVLQQFQLDSTGTIATQTGALILPQAGSGSQSPISGEYGSASEGMLQQSVNGLYLAVMGYGVNAATFNSSASSVYGTAALAQTTSLTAAEQTGTVVATVPRVVALIGANANVDTSTALTDLYNQNNARSVATVDGTAFWTSGQGASDTDPTQGVAYAPFGASTATAIDNSTDTRIVSILNPGSGNTLYVSRDRKASGSAGADTNVSTLASASGGLPTSASGLVVSQLVPPASPLSLGGNSASINLTAATANGVNNARIGSFVYLSPEQYFLASPTVLYVADSGQPKSGSVNAAALGEGGLQKWIYSNGAWTLAYVLVNGLNLVNNANANAATPTAPGVTGLIGLTGRVVDGQVQLFATSYGLNELSQSYLYEITDNLAATSISQASNEQFAVLYSDASGQTLLRGLAFAPGLPQQIAVSAPTVGSGGSATLSATGGASGDPVTFTSLTTSVCTVSGSTVVALAAGNCTIAVDQAGNSQYSPATEVDLSITVGGSSQTIAISNVPGSLTIGGSAIATATASSGLAVTLSTRTPAVCTVSGTVVTGVAAGTCVLAFDQSGNSVYAAAAEATASFSVAASQSSQTITLGPAPSSLNVGSTATLSATASSGLPVTFTSTTAAVCTVSGNVVTGVAAGTCTIAADQAGNASYSAAPELTESFPVGGGTVSGTDGDVPLPPWAYVLLAASLMLGTVLTTRENRR